jgi:hypothetical protein
MQPNKSIIANETSSAFTPASELAVSPKSLPYAGDVPYEDVPYELAVSPKSNDPSAGDVTAVSASNSNDTPLKTIKGKPPDQAWLAEHKFDGVDFTLPSPDSSEGPFHLRRRLQGKITTWSCHRADLNGKPAGRSVQIWWGHTAGDAAWACNEWHTACLKGKCTAKEVTQSHWNCYRARDLKFVGQASIWWGHGVGDGVWACNSWVSDCGNSQGGCLVTGAPHWNDGQPWDCHPLKPTWGDGCSVNIFPNSQEQLRSACDQHDFCYYGPIKNDFWDTYRHCSDLFYAEVLTKHWDFWDSHRAAGWVYYSAMTADPLYKFPGSSVIGPGLGDAFQNEQLKSDFECHLGKSKPQGYQWAPCKSGGGCVAGTSCYNCCAGDDGFTCKKPWWEP